MNETKLATLAQLEALVAGTAAVEFQAKAGEDTRYRHISEVLRRFRYVTLKRPDKGIVLRYALRRTRPDSANMWLRGLITGELGSD